MEPNAVGLARQQELVILDYRHALAKIIHEHFEFFLSYHPTELSKRLDMSGSETADLVETCRRMRGQLQAAWKKMERLFKLDPSRLTPRKTELVNRIIKANQQLLGFSGFPGWFANLKGEVIVAWAQGSIPDAEVSAEIHRRKERGKPMSGAEVKAALQRKLDAGWRPDVSEWVGEWVNVIRLTLYRLLATCFEFLDEIEIRYLHLDEKQTEAFVYDIPSVNVGDAMRAAKYDEAQRMADHAGRIVQIIDKQENIVGEKAPAQEKLIRELSVPAGRGKAARGDWSRRKDVGPSEGRSLKMEPNPEEGLDFDSAVLVEFSRLL
jgi:hypothetical protein